MSGNGSKFWGTVLTFGLTGGALAFLVGVMEESRFVHDPTPVFASVAAAAIYVVLLRGPVGRAIGKMLDGGTHDDQLAARVEELEAQVSELSADQLRMAELEERVDFAERLLARRELPVSGESREN